MNRAWLCTLAVGVSLSLQASLGTASGQEDKKPEQKAEEKKYLNKTIGEWIKILREGDDPKLRWAAVKVLEAFDTSNTGLPTIFEAAAKDKDTAVRIEAVRMIGKLDPKVRPAIKALVSALQNDKEGAVREVAATALGTDKFKKPAEDYVAELAAALKDPHDGTCIAVATTLRNMGEGAKPALAALLQAAEDPQKHPLVRQAAVHVISRHGKDLPKALPLMIDLARNPKNPVALRDIAIDGLGRSDSNSADVVGVLTETLADPNLELRKAAAVALGALGPKAAPGWAKIKTHTVDPKADSSVRNHLIRLTGIIGKTTPEAIDTLIAAAKNDDSTENRIAAIQELGELAALAKNAEKTLATIAAQDGRAAVRDAAAKALKSIRGQ